MIRALDPGILSSVWQARIEHQSPTQLASPCRAPGRACCSSGASALFLLRPRRAAFPTCDLRSSCSRSLGKGCVNGTSWGKNSRIPSRRLLLQACGTPIKQTRLFTLRLRYPKQSQATSGKYSDQHQLKPNQPTQTKPNPAQTNPTNLPNHPLTNQSKPKPNPNPNHPPNQTQAQTKPWPPTPNTNPSHGLPPSAWLPFPPKPAASRARSARFPGAGAAGTPRSSRPRAAAQATTPGAPRENVRAGRVRPCPGGRPHNFPTENVGHVAGQERRTHGLHVPPFPGQEKNRNRWYPQISPRNLLEPQLRQPP